MANRMEMFKSRSPRHLTASLDFKKIPGFNYVLSTEDEHTHDSLSSEIRS